MRRDSWLSDVLGFAVYEGDGPGGERPSLTYAKIGVDDTEEVARLTATGFSVVDVNVTYAYGDGTWPEPSNVEVAAPEHGDPLIDIAGRCFRFSRFHLDPLIPNELADRVKREWIRSYVEGRRGSELLAAVDDGKPLGFLAVLEDGDSRIIDLVGVAPEAQGRGVGRALVTAFVARHHAPGRKLLVGTQIANVPSVRLYESVGFSLTGAAYVLHLHRGA